MTDFAAWLEATRISKALFGITWLWPVCESLHFVGLCMLIGGAGLLDLRLLGFFRGLHIRHVKALMPWAIGGFVINLITGLVLFVTTAADRAVDPVFYLKLGSIAVALWFGVLVKRRAIDPEDAPQVATRQSRSLAAASLGLWAIAIVAGRLMAYLG